MNRNGWLPLIVLGVASMAAAQEPLVKPRSGALLMKNQQVLTGDITFLGDYYQLALGTSGRIRIHASEVELLATSVDEIYQAKAQQISATSLEAHLRLADWCLRQDLPSRAAEQIAIAQRLKPNDPRVAELEKKLLAGQTPATQAEAHSTSAAVSGDQLERTMRELPTGGAERFTVVIQPILFDRCGAGRCHGSSASAFQLVQPIAGRVPSKRYSQRNLFAVMQYIDREHPLESELLKKASQTHGGMDDRPFRRLEDERQLAQLVDWVQAIGRREIAARQPATVDIHQLGKAQRQVRSEDKEQEPPPSNARTDQPATIPTPKAALPTSVRDPFDPEEFNRRHASKQ